MLNDLEAADARLAHLADEFENRERLSLVERAPADAYVAFRLDGIKASKVHLKDRVENDKFAQGIRDAINDVYKLMRRQVPKTADSNLFVGAIAWSDEVSFLVNRGENYYERRLLKLATVLAGNLSARMTLHFFGPQQGRALSHIAFDARPILLSTPGEIEEYVEYRWLIAQRNACGKVLRLAGAVPDEELYERSTYGSLAKVRRLVQEHNLDDVRATAMRAFEVLVPNVNDDLVPHSPRTADMDQWKHLAARIERARRRLGGQRLDLDP